MENGFIKIYRQIQNWEWYSDSATVHFFLHCILSANWVDKNWRGETIKRGQFITSLRNLSDQTGLSVKQIRNRIKRLEKSGEILQKGANKFTIITVCKYDTYQPKHIEEGQTKGKQRANKGQTKGNNEEYKELKEGKEYNRKQVATVPTLSDVQEYFKQKGYGVELASKFFEYYNEPMKDRGGRVWKDQKGNTVVNWKQKALAVWMKEDNKQQQVIDGGTW